MPETRGGIMPIPNVFKTQVKTKQDISHYFQSAKLYTGHIQCGNVIAWQLYFPQLSNKYLFICLIDFINVH